MIRLYNVCKSYAKSATLAVDNLSLEIKDGEIFGFLGPNGAGKSTTIKMITGILAPTSGTIEVDGINVAENPIAAKSRIGFVPDNHETYETLKGTEYLNFIGTMYGVDAATLKARVEEYAKLFSMTEALPQTISSYSHGMKQKLLIIAALIHEPKVWVLDEPMTGLDPRTMKAVREFMKEYVAEGNCIVFSSHALDAVAHVCDRVVLIRKGQQLSDLNIKQMMAENPNFDFEQYVLENETNDSDTVVSDVEQ